MKTLMFRRPFLSLTILALASACTPHEDATDLPTPPEAKAVAGGSSGTPQAEVELEPEPEPEHKPETVTVAVASVQLQDDCPTPAAAPKPAMPQERSLGARSMPKPGPREAPGNVAHGDRAGDMEDGFAARCVQSEVQLSITSKDSEVLPFSIRAVRLRKSEDLEPSGTIETMRARAPRIWKGSTYATWDESIAPGSTLNVRYALGAPDWAAVEKVIDGSSWGPLYVVELEVEVAGRLQTISSPLAPREAIEEMVT
ncbi:MAG: hypothetical protein ACRBN8_21380 [Nannocystales bacterium]